MQTKKQKQEKALSYWKNELQTNHFPHRDLYIKSQIAILERKLTKRALDAETGVRVVNRIDDPKGLLTGKPSVFYPVSRQ